MNVYMKVLFIYGAGAFLTWWFLKGLLNPFINAVVLILATGAYVVLSFLLSPFIFIARSVYHVFQIVFKPAWVKILFYSLLGIGIFVLDHYYNTKIYAEDETTFYSVIFLGTKYWITLQAVEIGGFFLFLAAIYSINELLKLLDKLLDHPMHISIVVQK